MQFPVHVLDAEAFDAWVRMQQHLPDALTPETYATLAEPGDARACTLLWNYVYVLRRNRATHAMGEMPTWDAMQMTQ
jgi:heme/copper-type cytochrome/quinol oxidase subunit 2